MSTLTFQQVHDAESPDCEQVTALMERTFPSNEIVPMDVQLSRPGNEVLAIYEDDAFCGMISLLTARDITHIIFFAIAESHRNNGLGSRVLAQICAMKPGQRIIADLERPMPDAPGTDLRKRRIGFYTRNGFSPTQVAYTWRSENYIIFSSGGDLTPDEFHAFWQSFD